MNREYFKMRVLSGMIPENVKVMNDLLGDGLSEAQKAALEDFNGNLISVSYQEGIIRGVKDSLLGLALLAGGCCVVVYGEKAIWKLTDYGMKKHKAHKRNKKENK